MGRDHVGEAEQLDDRVAVLKENAGDDRLVEGALYQRVSVPETGAATARVALLQASGIIMSGKSAYDPVNGPVVGSDTIVEQIQRIRDDDSIRAIVLRVDSPGGSSVASDVIWRELMITRDAKPSRPIIVSMSDLAASGGYYISMPAPYIVAEPATLTGSIGVITGKIVTGGTYAKVGANMEATSNGRNSEMNSPT